MTSVVEGVSLPADLAISPFSLPASVRLRAENGLEEVEMVPLLPVLLPVPFSAPDAVARTGVDGVAVGVDADVAVDGDPGILPIPGKMVRTSVYELLAEPSREPRVPLPPLFFLFFFFALPAALQPFCRSFSSFSSCSLRFFSSSSSFI